MKHQYQPAEKGSAKLFLENCIKIHIYSSLNPRRQHCDLLTVYLIYIYIYICKQTVSIALPSCYFPWLLLLQHGYQLSTIHTMPDLPNRSSIILQPHFNSIHHCSHCCISLKNPYNHLIFQYQHSKMHNLFICFPLSIMERFGFSF